MFRSDRPRPAWLWVFPLLVGLWPLGLVAQNVGGQTIGTLSIRGQIGPNQPFISGFVIAGRDPTQILIRGAGPALAARGVTNPIQHPALTINDWRGVPIAQNIGWSTRPAAELGAIGQRGETVPFEANSNDCGLLLTLAPGLYTAQLSGVDGSSGIGLIELYQDRGGGTVPQTGTHFINVSTLCVVGQGEALALASLNLPRNRRLLIRAVGPSLSQFGVRGVLANPKLEIIRPEIVTTFIGGGLSTLPAVTVTTNDDWNTQLPLKLGAAGQGKLVPIYGVPWAGSADDVRAAAAKCWAFPIAEGTKDAAMFVTIDASPIQVQVSGADGGSGIVLVEVYDVDAM